MKHEVIVVGGGLGGLTTAALLAARGLDVCLFERQSRVGGCLANFEFFGQQFEPTYGLYSGLEADGVFSRIFSELSVALPPIRQLSPSYVVRLVDGTDIAVGGTKEQFEGELRTGFPECADAAIAFYRRLQERGSLRPDTLICADDLKDCSTRFRQFIDAQLKLFLQCASDRCSLTDAASAIHLDRKFWSIEGGAQALVSALLDSFQHNGGTLRLDAPVLRLAFGSDGQPFGIDRLSGQRVIATRAIISNLTVWDTYGKLIGASRTPKDVSAQLRALRSYGAYLLFLSMDRTVASRLPSHRILLATAPASDALEENHELFFTAQTDLPQDKIAVTLSTFTNAESWFEFHEDASEHERQDQKTLERVWSRLHGALPALGSEIEVIESATPQTYYELTRRKLGFIGQPWEFNNRKEALPQMARPFPNLYLAGDTVAGFGIETVARLAVTVAARISAR